MRLCVLNVSKYSSNTEIHVRTTPTGIDINNEYAQVDHLSEECNWDFLSEIPYSDEKCLTARDFNARSNKWEDLRENRQGIAIIQTLLSSNLTVLNYQRLATRSSDSGWSHIDLALILRSWATSTRWHVLGVQDLC
ncbi:hypothetical protein BsWGS_04914 [Bradybaena similaris]